MPLPNNPNPVEAGNGLELKIIGRVLNTTGVVFLAIAVALAAAVYDNIPAFERTAFGLVIAALMVVVGEVLSRRLQNSWFPTTMMSSGYSLAYFFVYATYYVAGLQVFSEPYLCWTLGPALGLIGTWHGTRNKSMRWFANAFTLTVTGHALFQAISSGGVVTLADMTVKVAAIGCLAGMAWCAALSALYKRFELRQSYDSAANWEEKLDWIVNRGAHELYFALSAANAMALPLFLSSFSDAPLWWALQAPILLAISWRSGNFIKHALVAMMWGASAVTLLSNALGQSLDVPAFLAVLASAAAMGNAYRFVRSPLASGSKVSGYCFYMYAGMGIALVSPYLQFGFTDSMYYWLFEAMVLCGLGMALRDRILHAAGCIAAFVGILLFGMHYNTWTWQVVVPMVAASYALSVGYSHIIKKGGWAQSDFLSAFTTKQAVDVITAGRLEIFWSAVGFITLVVAPVQLIGIQSATNWWAVQSLILIILGFAINKFSYRTQGLLAITAAACKLVVWDVSGGQAEWPAVAALTLDRSLEFAIVGGSALISSFLYFHRERALYGRQHESGSGTGGGNGGGTNAGDTSQTTGNLTDTPPPHDDGDDKKQ